jgi:hypothetical protein
MVEHVRINGCAEVLRELHRYLEASAVLPAELDGLVGIVFVSLRGREWQIAARQETAFQSGRDGGSRRWDGHKPYRGSQAAEHSQSRRPIDQND